MAVNDESSFSRDADVNPNGSQGETARADSQSEHGCAPLNSTQGRISSFLR